MFPDTTPVSPLDALVDIPGFGSHRPVDLYDAWYDAQTETDDAFEAWCEAPVRDRRDLQIVYRAALDREEQAAVMLAAAVRAGR
jgi:hypothetical protein